MYSQGASEVITGKHLREMARRDEIVLTTKVYRPMGPTPTQQGLSRKHIMEAIDASLSRLGMDYVDIYMIHRFDPETEIEETLEALNDVVKAGKARYIGASSGLAWQLAKALYTADLGGWSRFIAMQSHYNMVYREDERELVPLCQDQGVALTPWSPLARGFLAGNRHRQGGGETVRSRSDPQADGYYFNDAAFEIADKAAEIARERGVQPIQVALAWLLQKPAIAAPVVGVSRAAQLAELVEATDISLDDDEIAALEAPYRPLPLMGLD
jgi:aryl-alcohol dehydrogenase (NADP+)